MNEDDLTTLEKLEESLWRDETRFDISYMNRILAPTFFEFGRSGRIYKREDTLNVPPQGADAKFPLKDFAVHLIGSNVALVTYISQVTFGDTLEVGNRSSLWMRTPEGWQLQFHQGTEVPQS